MSLSSPAVDAEARLHAPVFRRFSVQADGMAFGAAAGHLPQWAADLGADDGGGGDVARKSYTTASLDAFWAHYVRCAPGERVFYETVLPGLPCRWHLDVDVDLGANPTLASDGAAAALAALLAAEVRLFLRETFAGVLSLRADGVDIVRLDSSATTMATGIVGDRSSAMSASGKLSWHWIVHMRAASDDNAVLLLADARHAGALTRRFDRFVQRRAAAGGGRTTSSNSSISTAAALRIYQRRGRIGDAAARCALYDLKIYSMAREFRVAGSHKAGSTRTLRITSLGVQRPPLAAAGGHSLSESLPFDKAAFAATLIQYYGSAADVAATRTLEVTEYDGSPAASGGTEYGHMRDLTDEFTPPAYARNNPASVVATWRAADAPLPPQRLELLSAALARGDNGVRTPAQDAAAARVAAARARAASHGGAALSFYYAAYFPFDALAAFLAPSGGPPLAARCACKKVARRAGFSETTAAVDRGECAFARREFAATYIDGHAVVAASAAGAAGGGGGDVPTVFARYQSYDGVAAWRHDVVTRAPLRIEIGAVYSVAPRLLRPAARARDAVAAADFSETADSKRQQLATSADGSRETGGAAAAVLRRATSAPARIPAPAVPRPVAIAVSRELVFDVDMDAAPAAVRAACCGGAPRACARCWRYIGAVAVGVLGDVLRTALGFRRLLFVFSGRRGVHCWVADERARRLDDAQRAAIVALLQLPLRRPTAPDTWPAAVRAAYVRHVAPAAAALVAECGGTADGAVSLWPVLDADVTRQRRHLLKAPFAVHPASRRVCVAVDPARAAVFDPARDAPTVDALVAGNDAAARAAFAAAVDVLRRSLRVQ